MNGDITDTLQSRSTMDRKCELDAVIASPVLKGIQSVVPCLYPLEMQLNTSSTSKRR